MSLILTRTDTPNPEYIWDQIHWKQFINPTYSLSTNPRINNVKEGILKVFEFNSGVCDN